MLSMVLEFKPCSSFLRFVNLLLLHHPLLLSLFIVRYQCRGWLKLMMTKALLQLWPKEVRRESSSRIRSKNIRALFGLPIELDETRLMYRQGNNIGIVVPPLDDRNFFLCSLIQRQYSYDVFLCLSVWVHHSPFQAA